MSGRRLAVRRATVGDAATLSALAAATFALACPPDSDPDNIAHYVDEELSEQTFTALLDEGSQEVFIVERGARPVGYAMLTFDEEPPAQADPGLEWVYLQRIYVLPDEHGRGAAQGLLAASLRSARARGFQAAWLGTNRHNRRARAFYRRQGFSEMGTREFTLGPEIHCDVVLGRQLEQDTP